MDRNLMVLGQELAAYQDDLVRECLDLQRGRARLLVAVAQQPRSLRVARVMAVAALLFSAAVVGYWLRGSRSGDVLQLVAGSGRIGEWIAAPGSASVPLIFTDGTKFELQPNGRARVAEVVPKGVTLVVERGELRASVRPRQGNRWRIDVGPFRVAVTGTVFDVSWQPEIERFSLILRKGAVVVAGPIVGAERAMHAGEQLDVWVGQGELKSTRVNETSSVNRTNVVGARHDAYRDESPGATGHSVRSIDSTPTRSESIRRDSVLSDELARSAAGNRGGDDSAQRHAMKTSDELPSTASLNGVRPNDMSPVPSEQVVKRSGRASRSMAVSTLAVPVARTATGAAAVAFNGDSFRSLAHANRFRDALVEAERLGFDRICNDGSAPDVLLLGDVARLAGNVSLAQKAYAMVRQRFTGGPAAQGAFMLGRIAHDQRSAFVEAAAYFSTYLREAPGGAFAREAAGRLMESRLSAGDREGARVAASQYLGRYPSGPHADKARELVAEP